MYLDIGRGSSDSATLAFTFSGTFSRYWDIKITQIPCGVAYDAPNGCLQYHTGIDGRFSTFNYGLTGTPSTYSHLRNQNYRICIRQEEGEIEFYSYILMILFLIYYFITYIRNYRTDNFLALSCFSCHEYWVFEYKGCQVGQYVQHQYCYNICSFLEHHHVW